MKIEIVDLKNQYLKLEQEINESVLNVIRSTAFINGPEVADFQRDLEEYLDVKHVIPCANGTDALQIAMMALGLKPGDEVITPSFTYIATAEVIALLGLTAVFIDVDPDTFTIQPEAIKKLITNKTKAIVPVHLYGQCANMEEILKIAKEYDLYVIEDNAQAIGADYTFKNGKKKKAGTMGHIGCTSFFPSKNLGCYGDGGAMFTNDDELAKKLRMVANHGQEKRYYHDVIGVNSRLDTIQAAILKIKLKHLDEYCAARRAVADYYNKAFAKISEITRPRVGEYTNHVYHQYTIKLNGIDRNDFQAELTKLGVPVNVYYPLPAHLQKGFSNVSSRKGDLTVTEKLMHTVASLPIHTEMDEKQLKFITEAVTSYIKSHAKVAVK
jgi:UDP-2-acetamido-2-deoxy-ribo-hexuluronate aminotransferase